MIPRRVFTIWLNENPKLPELVQKCISTKYQILKDYEHRIITLENCDRSSKYVRDCLETKKWVKASDFLRMHYLYTEGGIYLDADCEVLKSLDGVLDNRMFVAAESKSIGMYANGIVGAEAQHPLIGLYLYEVTSNFMGTGDLIFEPGIRLYTDLVYKADKEYLGIKIYDPEYFFPYNHQTGEINITKNTLIYSLI